MLAAPPEAIFHFSLSACFRTKTLQVTFSQFLYSKHDVQRACWSWDIFPIAIPIPIETLLLYMLLFSSQSCRSFSDLTEITFADMTSYRHKSHPEKITWQPRSSLLSWGDRIQNHHSSSTQTPCSPQFTPPGPAQRTVDENVTCRKLAFTLIRLDCLWKSCCDVTTSVRFSTLPSITMKALLLQWFAVEESEVSKLEDSLVEVELMVPSSSTALLKHQQRKPSTKHQTHQQSNNIRKSNMLLFVAIISPRL